MIRDETYFNLLSRTVKFKPKQKKTDEHEDCSDSLTLF